MDDLLKCHHTKLIKFVEVPNVCIGKAVNYSSRKINALIGNKINLIMYVWSGTARGTSAIRRCSPLAHSLVVFLVIDK